MHAHTSDKFATNTNDDAQEGTHKAGKAHVIMSNEAALDVAPSGTMDGQSLEERIQALEQRGHPDRV